MKSSLVLLVTLTLSARVMRVISQSTADDTFYNSLDTDKSGSLDLAELLAGYMQFDINGDKVITEEEFVTEFVALGLGDEKKAKEIFELADVDDDEDIDQTDLEARLDFLDANDDGTVSKEEFFSKS